MFDRGLFTLIFTGVWCLVGVIFLAVSFGLHRSCLRREERLRARATGTIAEVVRRVSHSSDGASASWYPIVEFEADGHTVSLESSDGGGRKRFYAGQSVEVLYDPDDPSCFCIEGFDTLRLVSHVFLGVGLGCVAIGLVVALIVNTVSR